MSARDKLLLVALAMLALSAGMWMGLVSPQRAQVGALSVQIATARGALVAAQTRRPARTSPAPPAAASLGRQQAAMLRAVPAYTQEAGVLAEFSALAGAGVDFGALSVDANASTSGAAASATSTTGPQALTLTFTLTGTYQQLQDFLARLDALAVTGPAGLSASGRLVTVTSLALIPAPRNTSQAQATLTAQIYQQGNAAGATGTTGATGATSTTASPS